MPIARNFDQSMSYGIKEPASIAPVRIAAAMADLGAKGYGIVRPMVRQTCFYHRSSGVIAVRLDYYCVLLSCRQ